MQRRDGPGDLAVDRRIAHVLVRRVAVALEEFFHPSREVPEHIWAAPGGGPPLQTSPPPAPGLCQGPLPP